MLQDRHTSHGRRGVVLTVQLEHSNEIVDLVDLVLLVGAFSKDSDPGYKAVSPRSYAGLDNDLSLSCCPS